MDDDQVLIEGSRRLAERRQQMAELRKASEPMQLMPIGSVLSALVSRDSAPMCPACGQPRRELDVTPPQFLPDMRVYARCEPCGQRRDAEDARRDALRAEADTRARLSRSGLPAEYLTATLIGAIGGTQPGRGAGIVATMATHPPKASIVVSGPFTRVRPLALARLADVIRTGLDGRVVSELDVCATASRGRDDAAAAMVEGWHATDVLLLEGLGGAPRYSDGGVLAVATLIGVRYSRGLTTIITLADPPGTWLTAIFGATCSAIVRSLPHIAVGGSDAR